MKNQLDLIISIVSVVIAGIICVVLFAMKPTVSAPPAAPTAKLTAPSLPDPATKVTFANALPGGSAMGGGGAMGFAGAGGTGGKKGPMSFARSGG